MADESRNAQVAYASGTWQTDANFRFGHDSTCMSTAAKDAVSDEFSFDFSVVSGTINGIELMIHYCAGDTNDFVNVELYDSTSTWRLKAAPAGGSGSPTCTSCTDQTVGGISDLWGGTWTATHIKSTSFRIRVTASASGKSGGSWAADYCVCKVYYTEAGAEQVIVTTSI